MSIKIRRGKFADLDTSRLVGGEFAVTDDPEKVFIKTEDGEVVELAKKDDLDNIITYEGAIMVDDEDLIFYPAED